MDVDLIDTCRWLAPQPDSHLMGHKNDVYRLQFSHAGQALATAAHDGTVRVGGSGGMCACAGMCSVLLRVRMVGNVTWSAVNRQRPVAHTNALAGKACLVGSQTLRSTHAMCRLLSKLLIWALA